MTSNIPCIECGTLTRELSLGGFGCPLCARMNRLSQRVEELERITSHGPVTLTQEEYARLKQYENQYIQMRDFRDHWINRYGEASALLNELSLACKLPGSPTHEECVKSVIAELEQLRVARENQVETARNAIAPDYAHIGRLTCHIPAGVFLWHDEQHVWHLVSANESDFVGAGDIGTGSSALEALQQGLQSVGVRP